MSGTTPTEPEPRTCLHCGLEARTRYETCPGCGVSYFAAGPQAMRRRRLAVRAGAAVLAVALAAGTTVALDARSERHEREREQQRRAVAAKRVELQRIQAPHRGSARSLRPGPDARGTEILRARRLLVAAVEEAITIDARRREADGELEGPITHAECGPLSRSRDAVPDDRDLDAQLGRYDCVAIQTSIERDGEAIGRIGHPFVATLDFERFTYVFCRNTPAQGEAGKALVFVRLERACLAAKGRALGTGYIDVPGS